MSDNSKPVDQDGWISENEAHRLLGRAVELDAQQRAAISVRELQQAAQEAGIAPGAFARALEELEAGALEPVTIGQRLSANLARFRRMACAAAFVAAAGITPGDSLIFSMIAGLGMYSAYEGAIALTRFLGKNTPPRVPPGERPVGAPTEVRSVAEPGEEGGGTRFAVVARAYLTVLNPTGA